MRQLTCIELEQLMNTVELEVKGMTCGSCAARVRNALTRVSGVDSVAVDMAKGRATVQSSDENLMTDELVSALADIGYPAQPAAPSVAVAGAGSASATSGHCGAGKAAGRNSGCCCGG